MHSVPKLLVFQSTEGPGLAFCHLFPKENGCLLNRYKNWSSSCRLSSFPSPTQCRLLIHIFKSCTLCILISTFWLYLSHFPPSSSLHPLEIFLHSLWHYVKYPSSEASCIPKFFWKFQHGGELSLLRTMGYYLIYRIKLCKFDRPHFPCGWPSF